VLLPYEDCHLPNYHRPKTVDEAVALSAEVAPKDGCILAGVDRSTGYLNIVKAERSAAAENRAAAR
jgi:hypothetical protein